MDRAKIFEYFNFLDLRVPIKNFVMSNPYMIFEKGLFLTLKSIIANLKT